MLDNRADYKDITIIYGSRTPPDLCYKDDLKEWEERPDVNLILTVDNEFPGWEKEDRFCAHSIERSGARNRTIPLPLPAARRS